MGPVSGQVRRWLARALQAWSARHPPLACLQGELEASGPTLSWEAFASLLERTEPILGGRAQLVEAARDLVTAELEARSSEHFGFSSERQALWLTTRVIGPSVFPELDWQFDAADDARVAVTVAFPAEMPPCPALFALIEGGLTALPHAAGRRFAEVTCRAAERSARFEIASPPAEAPPPDARRIAALTSHSGSVFIEANREGAIVFVSPNCQEIFGIAPEQVLGRGMADLPEPNSRGVAARLADELRHSDGPVYAEFEWRHPDRGIRWCATAARVFHTENGARHFVCVSRDVTEHKDTERLRRERADLLERVAQATPDAMLVLDLEAGQIEHLTEGDLTWLGLPREVFEGKSRMSLDQLVHPDDLPRLAAHRERAESLGPREVCQIELRVRQADASWRWLRLRDVVFSRKADGGPKEVLVCVGDITEQVRTAAELAESQERYRRVSGLGSDYSYCTRIDPDGRSEREWMTDAFFRITGYKEEELPPDRWEALVHPDDHAICRRSFDEGARRGSGSFDFRLLTRAGEVRWIHQRFEVVREAGDVLRMYGACRDVTEQREAEQARRLVEQRNRAITENSWDIIGELDPTGKPTYISPNLREVLGWEPEELIASENPDLLHPDDRPVISEQFVKMLQGASEARMELRVRHKQGGWRNIELTATAFYGEDGLRRGVFLGRDVTERLRLKVERERMSSVVEASSELIAIFEPDGRMMFLNRAGRRMTGVGSRALGNGTIFDLMTPSEGTRLRQEALDSALHERAWEGEFQIQPVDGEEPFPVLANVFRLPDPRRGEAFKVALVGRDIRARKRAENALHESEKRFRTLVENAFDLVAELDEDGNFVYASPRYRDLLDYDPSALLGQGALDLLHEEDRARIDALVESVEDRPLTDLGPLRVRSGAGTWHWLEVQVRPYRRRSGEMVLVVVCRDVTGRRETEEALRVSQEQLLQSQKMEAIGRLAGGVAHDFNNLLTAITGYSDLIYQELGEGDPLREDAAEILRASEQASALTRQLLAFSRRQVIQPRVVEINALVSDVDRLLRRLIGEQVELVTSLAPDVAPVRVDPGQVEQLLVNLAVNSRDAMPHGGRLSIETRSLELRAERTAHPGVPPGSWVLLSVVDTGEGMSSATVERIFEPFFTTKDADKGTGLGLSTVYGIVQQSGGHIRVDSEAQRGTTFTIYLPRSEETPDPAPPHPVLRDLRGSETVVLVENEQTVRRLLSRYLEEHGYPVLAAESAIDALRAVRRHEGPIDVLITDVRLPKMDGHALAERLRWDHPGLAVLFVSGFSEDEFAPHALPEDEHAFIQKPFSPPQLLQRLRGMLSSR